MDFGQMSTGGVAGFLSSSISGPLYVLSVLLAPGPSDIFDLDLELTPGSIVGLPITMLFGIVLAGLPCILLGMALSVAIGDRPMIASTVVFAMVVGAIGGAVLLRSLAESDLTVGITARGAAIGALTALVWKQLFVVLRSRKATVFLDD